MGLVLVVVGEGGVVSGGAGFWLTVLVDGCEGEGVGNCSVRKEWTRQRRQQSGGGKNVEVM